VSLGIEITSNLSVVV